MPSTTTRRHAGPLLIATLLGVIATGWWHRDAVSVTFTQAYQVMFKASGTGAVARGIHLKLGETLSVKDFGAVGDGVANDTTAIQSAITAAAGKTLRFPQGSYKISARINVSSGTRILADDGVTITQITQGEIVFYGSNVTNVTIRGFTLVGPGSAYRPILTGDTAGAITFDVGGGGHLVERVSVSGFFNGITGLFLSGFTVRECDVTAWRLYGVLASRTDDFHIEHNRIHGNDMPTAAAWDAAVTYALGQTATANGYMWMSLRNANLNNAPPVSPPDAAGNWLQIATYCVMGTGSRLTADPMSRSSISFNELRDNTVWDGIMSHDSDGLRIVGNDIRNVRNGIDLSSPTGLWSDHAVITSNYFEGTSTDAWSGVGALNSAIYIGGADSASVARNSVVSNNAINNFGIFNTGAQMGGGIVLNYTSGMVVSGNRIYGIGPGSTSLTAGIALNHDLSNTTVSGNSIVTGTSVAASIYALNATIASGLSIAGNSLVTVGVIPQILISSTTGDIISITGNTMTGGGGNTTAVRMATVTLTQLNVSGNAAAAGAVSPYASTGSSYGREYVDWIRTVPPLLVSTSSLTNQVPTITSAATIPAVDEPLGSLYLRTGGIPYVKAIAGTAGWVSLTPHLQTLTYSTSITPDIAAGAWGRITATDGVAFAINAPLFNAGAIPAMKDQRITVTIKNASGGALGAVTWNAVFKMSAWTQPLNGFNRSINFQFDGTNWIEVSRTPADVPN